METIAAASAANGGGGARETAARYGAGGTKSGGRDHQQGSSSCGWRCFQMPLHYPRYGREDYEAMPEWQLDRLLSEYGLPAAGTLQQKRRFAMGAFLWGGGAGGHSD